VTHLNRLTEARIETPHSKADVAGAFAAELSARLAAQRQRTVPALRVLRREASRRLRTVRGVAVLRVAFTLLEQRDVCPRWFAYELVHHHKAAMAGLSATALNKLAKGLAAWHEVDPFGLYLLGPAWRDGRVSDAFVASWTRSQDRWRRRSALVATVALNNAARGGGGDATRTFAICDPLLDDRDDMVVKALSWALRALAVRQPAAVVEYLDVHGDRIAARARREVRNKLRTGLKSGRRR
jgi:3-methyladenine DNA glycosylase AlkD